MSRWRETSRLRYCECLLGGVFGRDAFGPLSAGLRGWSERVGRADVVAVAVGGHGGGVAGPCTPVREVAWWWAEMADPGLVGLEGAAYHLDGPRLDEVLALL